MRSDQLLQEQLQALAQLKGKVDKPILAMLFSPAPRQDAEAINAIEAKLQESGIPSYPSYQRAAVALKKVSDYYRFHQMD